MTGIIEHLQQEFGAAIVAVQSTPDALPTAWIEPERATDILRHLKEDTRQPYRMLYDLTAVDERHRERRPPPKGFPGRR